MKNHETGPPIATNWRPNGRDVEVEVGDRFLVWVDCGTAPGAAAVVTLMGEDGELFADGDLPWENTWGDVTWFVPLDEIAPVRE